MIRPLAHAFLLIWLACGAAAQTSAEAETLSRAMTAMRDGDWTTALKTADGAGEVARDIIEWHRLRAAQGDFDSARRFLERRPDWPGMPYLQRRSEKVVPFGTRADDVIAFFQAEPPQTGAGAMALIAAHRGKGNSAEAEAEAVLAWQTQNLSEADETVLLGWYGPVLKAHHAERLENLVWQDSGPAAERLFKFVSNGQVALASARLALREGRKGVDTLVAAVPASLANDPGLSFERMQWRARKGRNADAIDLILAQKPDKLGRPGYWAGWRGSLARAEMRAGRTKNAYRLAAEHGLSEGSTFAELEWLAGYVALTYRNDPETALGHFLRFRGAVETPISLGRAGYWEGRAHEARGDPESARLAYEFGAEYQTSFYGLLAAEKAGRDLDPSLYAQAPASNWQTASFAQSSVFKAGRLLFAAGERDLAERFLTHLTETLPEDQVTLLAAWVVEQGDPHIAVMIGKRAADRGLVVPFAYFARADMGLPDFPVPEELVLSIARRESEFDPVVVSGAGARGLMQVMPATAKEVAGYLDIPFSRDRLLSDPVYNARIGSAYLDELMAMFDGNVVMVAAGYNAGPSRPLRWMEERGDPRRGRVDLIDWIEHIPFDETRNYIMRVTESLPVYRAQIRGKGGPVSFSQDLLSMPGHGRQAQKGAYLRPKARPGILID